MAKKQDDTNQSNQSSIEPIDGMSEDQIKTVGFILREIENGMTETDAATLHKSRQTWVSWKSEFPELKEYVRQSKLRYKRKMITAVNINSAKSGKIALEVLRRRWPEEWNVPKKIEHEGKIDIGMEKVAQTLDKILNGEEVSDVAFDAVIVDEDEEKKEELGDYMSDSEDDD